MLKMVDGTGIIGVDMVCPLGGAVSPPQPPNFDKVEMEGVGSLTLPNSLKAPLERLELTGNSVQGENPAPDNPQEIKNAGKWDEGTQKYEVDVRVARKNLFPYSNDFSNWKKYVNNSYFGSVTSDESGIKAEALKPYAKIVSPTFKLKPNTEYTVSAMIDTKDKAKSIGVRIFKNLNVSDYLKQIVIAARKSTNEPQKVSATFTTDDLKDVNEVYLQLDCSWSDSVLPTIVTFYDIQLELGNNATNYEPYTEQTVQIALDEPLRGVGEYKDVLTKDGVVRKIKQITVNEKSNLIFYTESKNTLGYLVKVPDATQTNYTYSVISDRFVKTQYIDSNDTNGVVTLFAQQIIFRVSKEIANNIDTLKEWLVDNNITFNYVLESPITEPLPESVQAQLSALHSENGVTHVFVDSGEVPCGIKLTYRKEK